MPLYEYQCEACGKRFETIQKFSDAPLETCKVCGKGPVRRLLSSPAIQFKGSGWYITDYAKKSSETKSGDAGSAAKSGDAGGSETKTDSAAKTETAAKNESAGSPAAPAASTSKE